MTIRPFSDQEPLEPILEVLHSSLPDIAERTTFQWKHLNNPFGPSPGYLAFLEGRLVGLRFFMRWEFRHDGRTIQALRPVDTVTLPSARGKGIFKRLTLHGLEQLVKDNYPVIFNTPNENSLPGYLKMGWNRLGEPVRYEYRIVNFLPFGRKAELAGEPITFPRHEFAPAAVETNKTPEFMSWRYSAPGYRFATLAGLSDSVLVYSMNRRRGVNVLNVVDFCGARADRYALIRATARATRSPLVRMVSRADVPSTIFSKTSGSSVVVMRAAADISNLPFQFSNGDLQSVL